MEPSSSLTKQEMDAVLQLIQLSGGSDDDPRILWVDFAVEKDKDCRRGGGSAAAEASSMSSSGSINQEEMLGDEPLPRTNHKFGSLIDIYGKTATATATPLIKNRSKKRTRF